MRRIPLGRRFPRRLSHWLLLFAGLWVAGRLWYSLQAPAGHFDFASSGPYHVICVQDGNSLLLQGNIAVRLIGVDTCAGAHPFVPQAAEFVRRRVNGGDVTVELDRERIDREGRILAYVSADGSLLNEDLIRAGFSRIDPSFKMDRTMVTRFRRAEDEARQEGRGIWQNQAVSAR